VSTLGLLCVVTLFVHRAVAAETDAQPASLSVQFAQDRNVGAQYGDALVFRAIVSNEEPSSGRPIKLKSITVKTRALIRYRSTARCTLDSEPTLLPGTSLKIPCRFAPKDAGWLRYLAFEPQALFSREIPLSGEVEFVSGDDQSRPITGEIFVAASFAAVFYGGVVGAILLSVFVGASRVVDGNWALRAVPGGFVRAIARAFRGGICAVLMILLTKVSGGPSAPIQIDVHDFSGGVLVGLFSIPLARWLWSRLMDA
jgi:hypothetical protein